MRPRLFLVLVGMVLAAWPGWAGDGIVALQTADASCRTTTTPPPRYVDCGNGTVTDNKTGLVWLKNANCIGQRDWHTAMEFVAGLSDLLDSRLCIGLTPDQCDCGLSDGSSPGEWRLASADEWDTMVAEAKALGCIAGPGNFGGPSITDDLGHQCWQEGPGNSFTGVVSSFYWSASTSVANPTNAWGVDLNIGALNNVSKGGFHYVWPVRGGQ